MASAFGWKHGSLTLSWGPPWPHWGPVHSAGMRQKQLAVATSLALGFPSLGPGAWGDVSGFPSCNILGEENSMNSLGP